jgi:hypothetical protein
MLGPKSHTEMTNTCRYVTEFSVDLKKSIVNNFYAYILLPLTYILVFADAQKLVSLLSAKICRATDTV